jgi:quercetin dioxygenase-like cupin family protein
METPGGTMALGPAVVLTAAEIGGQGWQDLPRLGTGVSHKVLWQSGGSMSGVMRIDPGGCLDRHAHRAAHHHFWIFEGSCEVLGRRLAADSYAHVPPGVDHGVDDVGDDGCVFFYLYLQTP